MSALKADMFDVPQNTGAKESRGCPILATARVGDGGMRMGDRRYASGFTSARVGAEGCGVVRARGLG